MITITTIGHGRGGGKRRALIAPSSRQGGPPPRAVPLPTRHAESRLQAGDALADLVQGAVEEELHPFRARPLADLGQRRRRLDHLGQQRGDPDDLEDAHAALVADAPAMEAALRAVDLDAGLQAVLVADLLGALVSLLAMDAAPPAQPLGLQHAARPPQ